MLWQQMEQTWNFFFFKQQQQTQNLKDWIGEYTAGTNVKRYIILGKSKWYYTGPNCNAAIF